MVSIRTNARGTKARKKPRYAERLNDMWRDARNPRTPLRRRLSFLRALRQEWRGMSGIQRTQSHVTLGMIGQLERTILRKLEAVRARRVQWMRQMTGLLFLLGSMASLLLSLME